MKISRADFNSALPRRSAAKAGFTMVEIALCLAIVGFALVAIIGVLPTGLSVQRNNREETIISQDATYLMDAIRSGARGLDDLTNYVYRITNVVTGFDEQGNILPATPPYPHVHAYTYTEYFFNDVLQPQQEVEANAISNGFRIIGRLSTPKYTSVSVGDRFNAYDSFANRAGFGPFLSNYVYAYVHAISGNATEKPAQGNADIRELGFSYKLISEVTSYASYDTNWLYYREPSIVGNTDEIVARSNAWLVAKNINTNLFDLRLRFLWPIRPNGDFGNGRQSYRTMVSGTLVRTTPSPTNASVYLFNSRSLARDSRRDP